MKTLKKPSGVQYTLTFQRFCPDFILNIQAFFDEIGTTGMRDCIVYELCSREGLVGEEGNPFAGWMGDLYDASIRHGALMNISEQEMFDEKFPGFPLSMCREFVKTIIK